MTPIDPNKVVMSWGEITQDITSKYAVEQIMDVKQASYTDLTVTYPPSGNSVVLHQDDDRGEARSKLETFVTHCLADRGLDELIAKLSVGTQHRNDIAAEAEYQQIATKRTTYKLLDVVLQWLKEQRLDVPAPEENEAST